MASNFLVIDPLERIEIMKALSSRARLEILRLLGTKDSRNVNQIAEELGLPQSTVSANLQVLEDAGLVETSAQKARKGSQKVCRSAFSEILIGFRDDQADRADDQVEVESDDCAGGACKI